MGLLDFIFRQAPGAIAGVKRSQRERQDLQRKQGFEDQDRARRDAMDKSQTEQLLALHAEQQQTAPLRRKLLEAQIAETQAQAAERGRVKPVEAKYALKTARGGRVTAVDEATGLDRDGNPVYEREPSRANGGGIDQGLKFNEVARLRGEFQDFEKPYTVARTAWKQMQDLAQDVTGASDINLLIAAAKAADPESVVREGEVAIQRTAASLADRVGVKIENLRKGELLSPAQRVALVKAIESRMGPLRQEYERRRGQYENLTKGFGEQDTFQVIGDDPEPFRGVKGGATSPAASQSLADQWEALVKGGMSPAEATAKLNRRKP